MKKVWLAKVVEENGLFYPYGVTTSTMENLTNYMDSKTVILQVCESKKEMINIVTEWRKNYINNGTYMSGGIF